MWNMVADEEVPIEGPEATASNLNGLGYRYELDEFSPGEHNTFALNDEYGPAAQFLADDILHRDPAHITFSIDPSLSFAELKLQANHAYWISGLRLRRTGSKGTIDAVSHASGPGDPSASGEQHGAGVLTGGLIPAIAYVRQYQTWGPVPRSKASDTLVVKATNLATATIDPRRAGLSCRAQVKVVSDGPIRIRLAGCRRTLTAG
jgi:hypothetical protein